MNEGLHTLYEQGGAVLTGQYYSVAGLTTLTLTHRLHRSPDQVLIQYLNQEAEHGYNPGDELTFHGNLANAGSSGVAIWCRPGIITTSSFAGTLYLGVKSSGAPSVITAARWKVRLKALWFPSMGRI